MKKNRREQGSALITTLIVVAVLALGTTAILNSVKSEVQLVATIREKVENQNAAESGINLAKLWLKSQFLTGDSDFIKFNVDPSASPVSINHLLNIPEGTKSQMAVSVLADSANKNTSINDRDKKYRIISTLSHAGTGKKFTTETFVVAQRESFVGLTFGLHNPKFGPFNFKAGQFAGRAHFGNFPTKPNFSTGTTRFLAPVTFASTGSDVPFTTNDSANVIFDQGFEKNYDISNYDPDQIMLDISSHISPSVQAWSNKELCLFLKDRVVESYRCRPMFPVNSVSYDNRYGDLLTRVDIPSTGLVIYSTKDIEVKGIYDGPISIASDKNIRIGGDLIARKQSSANYALGLIAKKDIVIPHYVPNGNIDRNDIDSYTNESRVQGVTNFSVEHQFNPSMPVQTYSDRDTRDDDYSAENGMPLSPTSYLLEGCKRTGSGQGIAGSCNWPSSLDIEAAMFAVTGSLNIQMLNEITPSSSGGGVTFAPKIYGIDHVDGTTKAYAIDRNDPVGPWFYTAWDANGVPTARNADPIYCINGLSGADCPLLMEKNRGFMLNLWITGSLNTSEFGGTVLRGCPIKKSPYTSFDDACGFWQKKIKTDPNLVDHPPPYFPKMPKVSIAELWRKEYPGDFVGTLAYVEPTPTPEPLEDPTVIRQ